MGVPAMTKAQDTPTTAAKSLTRRAILAGAVAMPALAVPALAAKGNVSFPDLAARYAAFYPRWLEQTNKSTSHLEKFNDAVFKASGKTQDQWPNYDQPGYDEHMDIVSR